jgi:hypothetical protein
MTALAVTRRSYAQISCNSQISDAAAVSQSGEWDHNGARQGRAQAPRYEFSFARYDTAAGACSATFFLCVISSIVGPKALVVG